MMFIFIYLIIIFVFQLVNADFLEKTASMNVSIHAMTVMMSLVCVIMGASQDGQAISARRVTFLLTMPTYIYNIFDKHELDVIGLYH